MALYVLFENKNSFLFLYFICLLLNLQMCQIILTDHIYIYIYIFHNKAFNQIPIRNYNKYKKHNIIG